MIEKTALITGAAQRIGAAIARHLHANNMNIVIHYRQSESEAEILVKELNQIRNNSALSVEADLCDAGNYQNTIERAFDFKNNLDVLINNASSFIPTPLDTVDNEQWNELISVNMQAPFFLSKYAVPFLQPARGCIINITDIYGDSPLKGRSVYSAAKAGLIMLTKSLAQELAPEIRVNGISPGAILWPKDKSSTEQENILSQIPLNRTGEPSDIANAVHFLIEKADYMTGQILNIDGGRTL